MQRGLPLDNHAFPVGGVPAGHLPADGVEMPLVLAIARQESAFDHTVISSAGARGLMQLMPATARPATASRAGVDFALERLTSDPAYNALLAPPTWATSWTSGAAPTSSPSPPTNAGPAT